MYIEYCNYNRYIENYELETKNVFAAIENGLDNIAIPLQFLKELKTYLPSISVAIPIDYPLGYSSTKVKEHMIMEAIRAGATKVDYVLNQYFFRCNFAEMQNEIKTALNICSNYDITLRLFLDANRTDNLIILSRLYEKLGVKQVFPTLGYHLDDFYDTLLNSKIIENKSSLSVIFNGHSWLDEHIKLVQNAKIFGVRIYNTDIWCKRVIGQGIAT